MESEDIIVVGTDKIVLWCLQTTGEYIQVSQTTPFPMRKCVSDAVFEPNTNALFVC